jgi:hypothetical protein
MSANPAKPNRLARNLYQTDAQQPADFIREHVAELRTKTPGEPGHRYALAKPHPHHHRLGNIDVRGRCVHHLDRP